MAPRLSRATVALLCLIRMDKLHVSTANYLENTRATFGIISQAPMLKHVRFSWGRKGTGFLGVFPCAKAFSEFGVGVDFIGFVERDHLGFGAAVVGVREFGLLYAGVEGLLIEDGEEKRRRAPDNTFVALDKKEYNLSNCFVGGTSSTGSRMTTVQRDTMNVLNPVPGEGTPTDSRVINWWWRWFWEEHKESYAAESELGG